jgi:hypothetical protein
MIKVNFSHSEDFLNRYELHVITERLLHSFSAMLLTELDVVQERISTLFTAEFIRDLVLCDADELYGKIVTIYDHLHELSERYCLEFYLKDIALEQSVISMPIRKNIDKERIRVIHERILTELRLLSHERQSINLPLIISQMEQATVASEMKAQLKLINSMKMGNHTLSDDVKALFPNWVNEFTNIFNFSAMSQVFGREITNGLNIDVCPYCNNEDIETINEVGAETRPDIDHFYPKSKFPFLALTLSNLIPAGDRCNKKYKIDKSMLGYVNPYITGINQSALFNFYFMFDGGRNIDSIKISLNTQGDHLDRNLALFRVEETHKKNNVKDWLLNFEERYQLLVSSGAVRLDEVLSDNDLIRLRLVVDVDKSPTKEQFQKLKIDALNYLSGRNYQIAE